MAEGPQMRRRYADPQGGSFQPRKATTEAADTQSLQQQQQPLGQQQQPQQQRQQQYELPQQQPQQRHSQGVSSQQQQQASYNGTALASGRLGGAAHARGTPVWPPGMPLEKPGVSGEYFEERQGGVRHPGAPMGAAFPGSHCLRAAEGNFNALGAFPGGTPLVLPEGQLTGEMQRMQEAASLPAGGAFSFMNLTRLFSFSQQRGEAVSGAAAVAGAAAAASQDDSEDPFDSEPPLLEELGIHPADIWSRTKAVLLFSKADHDLLADSDLCGPMLIAIVLAVLLFLGEGVDLYRTASILGYSLIPVAAAAFAALFLESRPLLRLASAALGVAWATFTASSFFESRASFEATFGEDAECNADANASAF
ncbi:RNA polymerase II degradation factor 1 [Cyclospora cayetanensis]|uniref:RNA polymerase II degradation factor 1 n=1 Tax=Cyclospora cayetanensis TaxID=88456 RepID=A0A6P6S2E9_9EIME|nr:RNA polymerase II degradation factor 1 [Cyclospora cayetanensis]